MIKKLVVAACASAAMVAVTTSGASAAIVCSGDDCWHTSSVYDYPTTSHVIVHEDGWRFGDHDHYRWREHTGRGFWHGDAWEDF